MRLLTKLFLPAVIIALVLTSCTVVPDVVDEKVGEYGWIKIFEKDGCTVWRDARNNPMSALVGICRNSGSISVSRR